jgi:hypothetical protein
MAERLRKSKMAKNNYEFLKSVELCTKQLQIGLGIDMDCNGVHHGKLRRNTGHEPFD